MTKRITLVALISCSLLGCPKKTADLELDAAEKAIAEAQAKRAKDCAGETYQAAEAAIAAAKAKAAEGDIEAAKQKAAEAKTLAEQASAAAKPGCADAKKEEEAQPDKNTDDTDDAAAYVNLEGALETIYFDYNDASIREDSKQVLTKLAGILSKSPGMKIEIEGHCDVRGSTEYNLSLGERRARSVEKYLTTQGVGAGQIEVISYGEERLVDLGDTEDAHAKNRRAELKKLQ